MVVFLWLHRIEKFCSPIVHCKTEVSWCLVDSFTRRPALSYVTWNERRERVEEADEEGVADLHVVDKCRGEDNKLGQEVLPNVAEGWARQEEVDSIVDLSGAGLVSAEDAVWSLGLPYL